MEQKIQMLLPILLRTFGPIFLRSGLGGLGGGAGTNNSPSFDEDDDDDDDDKEPKDDNSISGANGRKVSISLPTFPPDDDEDEDDDDNNTADKVINKQSQSENDQGVSSTHNLPSIVSASTPGVLNPNIDFSVFDAESSSSSTTEATPSSLNDDESQNISAAILDKVDLRQNDAAYLGSAPYVYELPPHKPNSEDESKNNEFNSIR